MFAFRSALAAAVFSLCVCENLFAENNDPASAALSKLIDQKIDAANQDSNLTPAPLATDAVIIRRTTLDLAGRIPTVAEVRAYLEDPAPDKRRELVERLLNSPDFAFHQANWFDETLMSENRADDKWLQYLRSAAAEDRPWDQMFREMMVPPTDVAEDDVSQHAKTFLKKRVREPDDMANDTSRLFFGVSINCAQCHDHPLVEDWKQDHYFGFKSFFARTFLTKSDKLAEKFEAEVKFKTTAGEDKQAKMMFLTGDTVDEPKVEKTKEVREAEKKLIQQATKEKDAELPRPDFRPREQLVQVALKPDNQHFLAKSIVNRVWSRFFGHGLVHPLDQMHSENPANHPEILAAATQYLIDNGYHLKPLIREIVLSDAYARSSQWRDEKPPYVDRFAMGQTRVLSPRQYAISLIIATSAASRFPLDMPAEEWAKQRLNLEKQSYSLANELELPTEHFQVSVDEALLFNNSSRIQNDLLRTSNDRLVGQMRSQDSPIEQVTTAFWNVYGREPNPDELAACREYLESRSDRTDAAIQQLVWALITSPELRFNY